jgi:hypothetical protein
MLAHDDTDDTPTRTRDMTHAVDDATAMTSVTSVVAPASPHVMLAEHVMMRVASVGYVAVGSCDCSCAYACACV